MNFGRCDFCRSEEPLEIFAKLEEPSYEDLCRRNSDVVLCAAVSLCRWCKEAPGSDARIDDALEVQLARWRRSLIRRPG